MKTTTPKSPKPAPILPPPDWRTRNDLDWLAAAIGLIAGGDVNKSCIRRAAIKLGVAETTLYRWLDHGLANVPTGQTVRLSELSGVPIEVLAMTRLGPFAGFGQLKKEVA